MFGLFEDGRQADGLIVIGSSQNEDAWRHFKELADQGYSVVFWGSPYAARNRHRADNRSGGEMAARHLLDQGCRRSSLVLKARHPSNSRRGMRALQIRSPHKASPPSWRACPLAQARKSKARVP